MPIQNGLLDVGREEGEMAKQADVRIRVDSRRGALSKQMHRLVLSATDR